MPEEASTVEAAPVEAPAEAASAEESAAKPTETPAGTKPYKLNINGEIVERNLTEEQTIRLMQKGIGAEIKFSEAANARREAAEMLKSLEDDPEKFFKSRGKDAREWAEKYLWDKLQRENLPPAERRALEMQEELAQYKAEKEMTQKQLEEHKQAQLEDQVRTQLDHEIRAEMEKSAIARKPLWVQRVAHYLYSGHKSGTPITTAEAVKLAEEDYLDTRKSVYEDDDEKLLEQLGEKRLQKLNSLYAKKNNKEKVNFASPAATRETKGTPKAPKGETWEQIRSRIRSQIANS